MYVKVRCFRVSRHLNFFLYGLCNAESLHNGSLILTTQSQTSVLYVLTITAANTAATQNQSPESIVALFIFLCCMILNYLPNGVT